MFLDSSALSSVVGELHQDFRVWVDGMLLFMRKRLEMTDSCGDDWEGKSIRSREQPDNVDSLCCLPDYSSIDPFRKSWTVSISRPNSLNVGGLRRFWVIVSWSIALLPLSSCSFSTLILGRWPDRSPGKIGRGGSSSPALRPSESDRSVSWPEINFYKGVLAALRLLWR